MVDVRARRGPPPNRSMIVVGVMRTDGNGASPRPPLVDAFGLEAERVAVERERLLDVGTPQDDVVEPDDLHDACARYGRLASAALGGVAEVLSSSAAGRACGRR